jgi:acyl transferase domain-containing protein/phosphopantetheinyl transferase
MKRGRPLRIAIVGMGCHFPGAGDLTTYWENILAGKDCIRDVPPDRWNPQTFCDPVSAANDRVPCCRGGYLDSPLLFDAAEHGIMPRTAEGGEPEQFLVLEAAMAALADAGLTVAGLRNRRVEVVIGKGNYFNRGNLTRLAHGRLIAEMLGLLSALHPEWSQADLDAIRADLKTSLPPFEAATIPGQLTNASAGRLANRLDLKGASYVIDAASASSLVALYSAARGLVERRADLALVGGVYLEADVDFPLVFRQLGAVSKTGSTRPFAADADGMLPGEGAGVVILKRLADAERDGDRVYAIVQGIGLASDGKSAGLASPSASGHTRAIRMAYRSSGIDPDSVALVEGHGLGVPAADRAELQALSAVFLPPRHGRRVLGAVSSMIGHAMPAAGMAGLIKSALALFHRVLPPTLHALNPHPILLERRSSFALLPTARPWIHPDEKAPRRAGVNSFGFAGINAHAVLEEHPHSADAALPGALLHWETEAILLSAPDRAALIERASELIGRLQRDPTLPLKDVAYTLNCTEEHPPEHARLALVASSVPDLIERLTGLLPRLKDRACRAIRDGRGAYYWDDPLAAVRTGCLAFLFPGEGSQYPGMLADLCFHFPEVRRLFDTGDRIALELGETVPPSEHLFCPAASQSDELWSASTAVNVVLSAQWALYQVLTRLGLQPDAVVGHSSGELLALAAAGVLEADRELETQLGRLGTIFRGFESSGDIPEGRLVAAATSRKRVDEICRDLGAKDVAVAIDNCPHQVVLAGPPEEVERVVQRLRQGNILYEDMPFARAYHTPAYSPVLAPVADFFGQMTFRPPRLPVYSCATGGLLPQDPEAMRALAVSQWTRTVAFRETIEVMHADGLRLFVDVGSRGILAGFVEDTLRGKPAFAVATNLPRRSGPTQLNHLVAATFAQGVPLRADYLYARRRPKRIDWNRSEPPPHAGVELLIGFPTMKLSEDLVARLRARPQAVPAPPPPHKPEPFATPTASFPQSPIEDPSRWDIAANGAAEEHGPAAAAVSILTRALERFTMERGSDSNAAAPAASFYDTGHERSGSPAASETDNAMLSFQETMRAFLQTQQEVFSAYLGRSSGCAGEKSLSASLEPDLAIADDDATHSGPEPPPEYGPPDGRFAPDQSFENTLAQHQGPKRQDRMLDQAVTTTERLTTGPRPGPWVGEVRRLVPHGEIETVLVLDNRNDPIAEHHTLGGRRISALDPSLRGLPVLPFAVMAEMSAQVAALIVSPGLVLNTLVEVRAHKWVRYEDVPIHLEFRGRFTSGEGTQERVWVGIFNCGPGGALEPSRPVFEAVVVFGASLPPPAPATPWALTEPQVSRFTAQSLYGEQWLFHGPPFQALVSVGKYSEEGMDGTLRVLPWEPLVRAGQKAAFHTDLIVIDSFTHLLGCWAFDYLRQGDVVFPLRLEALELYGDRPPVGTHVACRIFIKEVQRHRVRVLVEIVRADGTVWIRIRDWEDWRFHWPSRYRDAFRQPQDIFVGEEIALSDPVLGPLRDAKCVWLEPPADMGRPIWRDVLEQTQLGPSERTKFLATAGPDRKRSHRLWGRIAAKEAARRLWVAQGLPAVYPADLAVGADGGGRPLLFRLDDAGNDALPFISITHADGVAIALACTDSASLLGIDVETIADRPVGFEESAFTATERALLGRWSGPLRAEWVSRFWCAKEAAAKATGTGLGGNPQNFEVVGADEASGELHVRLAPDLLASSAGRVRSPLRVISARRNDYVWAFTLGEGTKS